MAKGISFLHANNIIHRDMKPENIMIDGDGDGDGISIDGAVVGFIAKGI